jgi:hypothetical protein
MDWEKHETGTVGNLYPMLTVNALSNDGGSIFDCLWHVFLSMEWSLLSSIQADLQCPPCLFLDCEEEGLTVVGFKQG